MIEARWKGAGLGDYYCSHCCSVYSGGYMLKRCPNCGAIMYSDEEYKKVMETARLVENDCDLEWWQK